MAASAQATSSLTCLKRLRGYVLNYKRKLRGVQDDSKMGSPVDHATHDGNLPAVTWGRFEPVAVTAQSDNLWDGGN